MNKEKVQQLLTKYRETKNDLVFNELYTELSGLWKGKLRATASNMKLDIHDLEATYDDAIMKLVDDPSRDADKVDRHFTVMLRNARIDLLRRTNTVRKREIHITDSEDENGAATLERLELKLGYSEASNYEKVADKEKEADQLQLIDSLIDPGKVADRMTTAIVETVLGDRTLGQLKPTAIGKKLGVHHSKVTRKLSSLKKNYDESLYGDYRDYLHA